MGAFTVELQPEDQNSAPGIMSFAKLMESSYRTKNNELKAILDYTRTMNTKADAIMSKTLEKNPAILNKFVNLYKNQLGDFALIEMLAAHNLEISLLMLVKSIY